MKKLILSILCVAAVAASVRAGTGDVRLPTVNADGATYGEQTLTYTAGYGIAFGATAGTYTSFSLSSFVTSGSLATTLNNYALASTVPAIRAGNVTVTAAATKAVTFSTAFPAGTTYVVQVIPNGLATSGYAASMTVSGFTLTLPLAVTGTISYIATPVQ